MCNRRKGKTSYVQKKRGKVRRFSFPTNSYLLSNASFHSFIRCIVLILGASPEEPDEEDKEGEDILEEEEEEEEHESESESSGMGPPSSDSSSLSGSRSESIPKASSARRSQPILPFAK